MKRSSKPPGSEKRSGCRDSCVTNVCLENSRRMETEAKAEKESEAQVPDNIQLDGANASGLEDLEQLMKSAEVLLSDAEQLRSRCSHQATELMSAALELKQQQEELRERYTELSREMFMDAVDDLFNTKEKRSMNCRSPNASFSLDLV